MTLPQTKAAAEAFADAVIPYLTTMQDARVTAGRKPFPLARLPYFPETNGGAKVVRMFDRQRGVEKDEPDDDATGGYATRPTRDALGFVTDPGTLEAGRTWEEAPVLNADGYYDPEGKPGAKPPRKGMTWGRFQTQSGYTLPTTMDFAAEVNTYQLPKRHPAWTPANRGLGWSLTIIVLWAGRTAKHERKYGFGPAAAAYTRGWVKTDVSAV